MKNAYDIAIIGGGVIGSAIAYFLAADKTYDGSIVVFEQDPSYAQCSTALSAASIRQQFSTSENIEISKFGSFFIKHIDQYLTVEDESPALDFMEGGYLFLATEQGLETLKGNHALQKSHQVDVVLLSTAKLRERFSWLNTDDLAAGSLGLSGEGWFDAYSLMQAFRRKARSLGVTYINNEVVSMTHNKTQVLNIRISDGEEVACGTVVNAAGARADRVAAMAGIELPVRPRKRFVFVFDCYEKLPGCPLLVDPTGVYVRPEGQFFICGMSPPKDRDPDTLDFDIDYSLFYEIIWPTLAHRIVAFEAIKLIRSWAGHYAYNLLDQNLIIGRHPVVENFIFANGFSGHGLQQAPAVGRAVSELLICGSYQTIDLTRFRFERLATGELVTELNVV